MPDLDARWCRGRDEKILLLETLKFETVWFILVLFYVMVVFSVVVPIASRFNYQVDMLLLLINHPCAGAPPLLRVSLNSLSAWSGQLSWRDTAVTYLQTWRLENSVAENHKQTLGIELTCSIVATSDQCRHSNVLKRSSSPHFPSANFSTAPATSCGCMLFCCQYPGIRGFLHYHTL